MFKMAVLVPLICVSSWASVPVKVGSKANIESALLGEIATVLAEQSGGKAKHSLGLGGTQVVWKALLRADIDVYAEYTGTLVQELLVGKVDADLASIRQELGRMGLKALDPLGFNNTYAIGVGKETAARLGLNKISDLSKFPQLRFGFSHEFMNRAEGWPSLKKLYALEGARVRGMEHEMAYLGLDAGSIDVTDVYSTDAEVGYYRLKMLDDDKRLFPRYDALYIYRAELEKTHPEFIQGLKGLSGKIPESVMISLNQAAKLQKQGEREIAVEFLRSQGLLGGNVEKHESGLFWRYTREHLYLVVVSLIFTILVAVPLGVIAYLRPTVGEVILAATGVVQTIPSLALLVFMIPFLGIGSRPALVALFLYGLLPILRNTYTGLKDIPLSLLESAEAIGLPRWVRLLKIELPLASRAILAGVKTTAVINVGTATLGAIIGAGGYGEPILMGIRRDDISLILLGAVPAAVLALLVQLLFECSEKYFIPRGLRLKPNR